jgi:hypothetical protein
VNVAQANLEDVLAKYYAGTAARSAAAYLTDCISRQRNGELETLLRDYRGRPITAKHEIDLRAATDRLLTCYSILEISSMANFVPQLPHAFASEARSIIEYPQVRRYYEQYYSMKLPILFRRRLAGERFALSDSETAAGIPAILSFLDLDRQFTEKLEDRTLLRMLDSFTIDGYRFRDLVALIETPERFVQYLLGDPQRETLGQAARELGLFLQFCVELRGLLDRTGELPVLQSAMWSYYGYWFDVLGEELNRRLGDALTRFPAWQVPAGSSADDATHEIQKFVRHAQSVIRDLTSRKYAAPIDALLS